jgi:glycosyltransferase involved in cell wall biosynthesis
MITNRDIVVVGIQAWDISIGSNCKNIAMEFAKHNRVLYVNYPLDRMTIWRNTHPEMVEDRKKRRNNPSLELIKLEENLWNLYPNTILESVASLPYRGLFKVLNHINNKRFANQILKTLKMLNFSNIILFNDSDMFRSFYLKEMLKPVLSCYYTRDNMLGLAFWHKHGQYMEPALMAKSDLVFANSTYLAKLASKHNLESHYVGQGCDLSLYDKKKLKTLPSDMEGISRPIIGYTGALFGLRLDVEILIAIAKAKPDWSLVLIGPEDAEFAASELHKMPNIHFLGNKNPDDLPRYINGFDVALNPQKLNEITIGNYPRKIDEYLALGKPVVATKTEAMSVFADYTYLAPLVRDYVPLIEQALIENTPELEKARTKFAKSHSWENNVKAIYLQMERMLNVKKTQS